MSASSVTNTGVIMIDKLDNASSQPTSFCVHPNWLVRYNAKNGNHAPSIEKVKKYIKRMGRSRGMGVESSQLD